MKSTPNHVELHVAEFRFTACHFDAFHFTEFRCNDSVFHVFDRIA